jgi:hypothetical protein
MNFKDPPAARQSAGAFREEGFALISKLGLAALVAPDPEEAWRIWNHRRPSHARMLAPEDLMPQMSEAYAAALDVARSLK